MNVITDQGTILSLVEPALASGGEGSVYRIQGYPNKLIKIYNKAEEARAREEKVRAMVRICRDGEFQKSGILKDISWPLSSIYDSQHNFIGFGMNAIGDGLKLDDVYDYPPKGNANISILDKLKCLISMCDIITKLHNSGNEFGDFNPENIMVNRDMSVGFIDADSYHLHIEGKTYKCIVCAPGYIAPEIIRKTKGTTFEACSGVTFTKESDYFGLAVHCFCMLMNGCHPFKCAKHKTGQGSSVTIKPIDLRVERGETPFFNSISGVQIPDWAPRIDDLPDYLVNMFRRAFVEGHNNPTARPNEKEWKAALVKYRKELKQCTNDRTHQYWMGKSVCPYCEAINRKKPIPCKRSYTAGNGKKTTNHNANVVSGKANGNTYSLSANEAAENNAIFWTITIMLSVILYLGGIYAYYQYLSSTGIETEWYVDLIAWIGVAGGVVGTCLYNSKWSCYAKGGCICIADYAWSLLYGIGFCVGAIIASLLIAAVVYIVVMVAMYALAIVFVLAIISGLLSG